MTSECCKCDGNSRPGSPVSCCDYCCGANERPKSQRSDRSARQSCCDNCCECFQGDAEVGQFPYKGSCCGSDNSVGQSVSLESVALEVPTMGNLIKTKTRSDKVMHNYVTKNSIQCRRCDDGPKPFMIRKDYSSKTVCERKPNTKLKRRKKIEKDRRIHEYKKLYCSKDEDIKVKYNKIFNPDCDKYSDISRNRIPDPKRYSKNENNKKVESISNVNNKENQNHMTPNSRNVVVCNDQTCGINCCCLTTTCAAEDHTNLQECPILLNQSESPETVPPKKTTDRSNHTKTQPDPCIINGTKIPIKITKRSVTQNENASKKSSPYNTKIYTPNKRNTYTKLTLKEPNRTKENYADVPNKRMSHYKADEPKQDLKAGKIPHVTRIKCTCKDKYQETKHSKPINLDPRNKNTSKEPVNTTSKRVLQKPSKKCACDDKNKPESKKGLNYERHEIENTMRHDEYNADDYQNQLPETDETSESEICETEEKEMKVTNYKREKDVYQSRFYSPSSDTTLDHVHCSQDFTEFMDADELYDMYERRYCAETEKFCDCENHSVEYLKPKKPYEIEIIKDVSASKVNKFGSETITTDEPDYLPDMKRYEPDSDSTSESNFDRDSPVKPNTCNCYVCKTISKIRNEQKCIFCHAKKLSSSPIHDYYSRKALNKNYVTFMGTEEDKTEARQPVVKSRPKKRNTKTNVVKPDELPQKKTAVTNHRKNKSQRT